MNNTYIQNKLDEFDRLSGLYSFEEDSLNEECCENGDKLHPYKTRNFIKQSLTDYHNHIVEKIVKDVDMTDQQLQDIVSLLQDTKYE